MESPAGPSSKADDLSGARVPGLHTLQGSGDRAGKALGLRMDVHNGKDGRRREAEMEPLPPWRMREAAYSASFLRTRPGPRYIKGGGVRGPTPRYEYPSNRLRTGSRFAAGRGSGSGGFGCTPKAARMARKVDAS